MPDQDAGETSEQGAYGGVERRRHPTSSDHTAFLLLRIYEQNARIYERIKMTQASIDAIKADLDQMRGDMDRITTAVQGSLTTIADLQKANADLQAKIDNLQADTAIGDAALNDLKTAADEVANKTDAVADQLEGAVNPPTNMPAKSKEA